MAAPDMEHTENFDKAEWGLTPVKLEMLGGFMWINLDPDSVPLPDYLGAYIADVIGGSIVAPFSALAITLIYFRLSGTATPAVPVEALPS